MLKRGRDGRAVRLNWRHPGDPAYVEQEVWILYGKGEEKKKA